MLGGKLFVKGWDSWCWLDDWLEVDLLHSRFPRVFRVMSNKESSVKDCCVVRDNVVSWELSFRRSLHHGEEVQYEELLVYLSTIFYAGMKRISASGNRLLLVSFLPRPSTWL